MVPTTPAPTPVVETTAAETAAPAPAVEEPAEDVWPHETLDFLGDTLRIRTPRPAALSALPMMLADSNNVEQNRVMKRFLSRHLHPDDFQHVMDRSTDPDEVEYSITSIADLFGAVLNAGTEAFKAAAQDAENAAKG